MLTIQFESIKKTFGSVTAINDLQLTINEGEVYALLGHNGAGKTTTLRLLLGLLEPDHGTITVFGKNPLGDGDTVRRMCGVLSEDVGLYESLTVDDNLRYYADIYGMSRVEANKRIDQLLDRFDLFDKKCLIVKGFSTGMKKKVALIRAMLHRPRILLLDEQTNGLDPVSTADLRTILSQLAREQGTTIIMTTHNLEEVQKMCDRISILRHGQNILTASISALKNSNQYVEQGQFSLEKLYMDIETIKTTEAIKITEAKGANK
ncbi:MAG: ABC transporter ATP-binding protein [Lachnospiraceae bacterium]|jgi:ABC-2 type transport system ATP-binding protein|nr:ABC transporter ATP-binding protein [Lachnospiraceae bacterium]